MRSTFGNAKTERRQSDAFEELEGEECPRTREASGSRRQRLWLLETGSFWNARKRARAQCMLHDPMPVLIFFPHLLDPPPSSLPYCNLVLRATRLCNNKTTGIPPGALFLPLSSPQQTRRERNQETLNPTHRDKTRARDEVGDCMNE
jgi:hypothetical protein